MNAINKVLAIVFVYVLGMGISFITGNLIVTALGSFLCTLLLLRGGQRGRDHVSKGPTLASSWSAQDSLKPTRTNTGILCSNCGATATTHTKFCTICGFEMAAAIRRQPRSICSFCGTETEPSDSFCINCGREVRAPVRPIIPAPISTGTCGRCGATVNPRKHFCTKCGAALPATMPP